MDTKERCKRIRRTILDMVYDSQSGHIGGSFSAVEIMTTIYFEYLTENDKVIISKGHASPLIYSILYEKGILNKEDLKGFRKTEGRLEGHVSCNSCKGIDFSSGSLGQGLSVANGMAIVKKREDKLGNIYCLLGDGELQEGQIWEALMTASKENLSNLIILIDKNRYQLDGAVEKIKQIDPLGHKLVSFNIETVEIDGHNLEEIRRALDRINKDRKAPLAIICNTVKGKGVSFMENTALWHGKAPNEEEYKKAIIELEKDL